MTEIKWKKLTILRVCLIVINGQYCTCRRGLKKCMGMQSKKYLKYLNDYRFSNGFCQLAWVAQRGF